MTVQYTSHREADPMTTATADAQARCQTVRHECPHCGRPIGPIVATDLTCPRRRKGKR